MYLPYDSYYSGAGAAIIQFIQKYGKEFIATSMKDIKVIDYSDEDAVAEADLPEEAKGGAAYNNLHVFLSNGIWLQEEFYMSQDEDPRIRRSSHIEYIYVIDIDNNVFHVTGGEVDGLQISLDHINCFTELFHLAEL